jgi:BirA family biotin operon repressor/biotin-[acetyl-CoA-carboxylase] ligase
MDEPLDLARVTQDTWIERVHFYNETDSTNTRALEHAATASEALTELFVAERQTAGRGRGNNRWWSDHGSLTWSVLTRAISAPPASLPQASLTIGLAICEAVEQFTRGDVALKWPNDVYLDGKKLAGILIELAGSDRRRLVIGVGLNVNNSVQNVPSEVRARATSLIDNQPVPGTTLDRTAVLVACLTEIERHLSRFENEDAQLCDEWRSRSLLTGRTVTLTTPKQEIRGVCEGLADDGALLLRTAVGVEACYGGVIVAFE